MIINDALLGFDFLLLGLAANASESILGEYADGLSHVFESAFSVAVASEALALPRRCFFHHFREAEGPCVATMCSRLDAALVVSSQSDPYFDLRLR